MHSGLVESSTHESRKITNLLNYVQEEYVDSVDLEGLTEQAIISMLDQLDPHSSYIPARDLEAMNEPLNGNFDGIGVEFNIIEDTIVVVAPISGGPSEKLGIRSGDRIVMIEDSLVAGIGITNKDVIDKLRGERGTKVRIEIARRGQKKLLPFTIERDKIPIYSVDASYMVNPEVGYIKVSRFAKTTMEELRTALKDLKSQGMQDLILDLQGNGGGMLNTAIEMADEFLTQDKLIVYTEGRSFPRDDSYSKFAGLFEKGRLVVLIDEGSASASEIVSGAVQDWDRGLIVGRRSFGKGLVQRAVPLPDGSAVRLTVQRYYTPSGRCIQKPYEEGLEAYQKEKYDRYLTGELFNQDSIHLPDSLKFFTNIKKRIVYGGGGILPDVFVAIDTSMSSNYFSDLIRAGVFNSYVLNYVDENRKSLSQEYPDAEKFIESYQVSKDLMDGLIAAGEKEEVKFDQEGFDVSKTAIELRLKALVARNLYDYSAFFKVINVLNPSYNKALEVLKDGTFERMKLAYSDF
ncbi:MAG: S41 family peptidase [Bacteroidetes bacterium]|nr:MAG: S41 family peptidase [Bacteroidota bacterium]